MQEMCKEVVARFSKIELQEWKAEGAMIELSKQVGELAKQVMIKGKYYALTDEVPDVDERLGNEMAGEGYKFSALSPMHTATLACDTAQIEN